MSSPDEIIRALAAAHRTFDHDAFQAVLGQRVAALRRAGRNHVADSLEREARRATAALEPAIPRELASVVERRVPALQLTELVLEREMRLAVERLIAEQRAADALREHHLVPSHKVLLVGPPGCGKTSLAGALACALGRNLYVVREGLVGSYLGETPARLAKVMGFAASAPCVLLLDEVDGLARGRTGDGDGANGEMRRVLLALLGRLDGLPAHVLLVAATNRPEDLDAALWRRFDLVLRFEAPSESERNDLVLRLRHRHRVRVDVDIAGATSLAEVERRVVAAMRAEVMARRVGA